jgi:hypothetical protein
MISLRSLLGKIFREPTMDERRASRLLVHCQVVFLGDHVVGKGTMIDLSSTGCGVESTSVLRKGTQLALHVTVPGQEDSVMVNAAAVRWSLGRKFGLKFVRMKPAERTRLRRFIKQYV